MADRFFRLLGRKPAQSLEIEVVSGRLPGRMSTPARYLFCTQKLTNKIQLGLNICAPFG
jgi:hypothetical protein